MHKVAKETAGMPTGLKRHGVILLVSLCARVYVLTLVEGFSFAVGSSAVRGKNCH